MSVSVVDRLASRASTSTERASLSAGVRAWMLKRSLFSFVFALPQGLRPAP